MNKVVIQQQDFDLTTEVNLAKNDNRDIGAIVSFIGTVRDLKDEPITKMTLEHYPKMTQKALESIVNQANQRWALGNITIIHRFGEFKVTDQIVLIITTSKHRKSAFEACEFIMDYLKTQAPFWKKEHTKNTSKWVQSKITDENQANRWQLNKND